VRATEVWVASQAGCHCFWPHGLRDLRLSARGCSFGWGRRTLLVGFTGIVMGITLLVVLPAGGLPVVQLLAAFTLSGAGLGAASVASTQTGTDAADPAFRAWLRA
jgi:hypothetical protein